MVLRLTSSLNKSRNDTGRTAFCGPTVLSAITGFPVSTVEQEIWRVRQQEARAETGQAVTGTYGQEVAAALAAYGYEMALAEDYKSIEKKARPTVWSWMQKPRNAWAHYILGIHKGRQGHWILVHGVMICDTYTGGSWTFAATGPHKGAKIMDVHLVRKSLGV